MSLPFRPAIQREYEEELLFELPQHPWAYRSGGIGGSAVSAAGVPESYVIRRDRIVSVTLRVLEEELEYVLQELEAIRDNSEAFDFAFDQDDFTSWYNVYLHSPVWPQEITPERDEEFLGAFRLTIELRTSDGSSFLHQWSAEPLPEAWEVWPTGLNLFSDQDGEVPQTTPGGTIQAWTGVIRGWRAIWDNAGSGGTAPVLNATADGITMVGSQQQNLQYGTSGVLLPLFAGTRQPFSVLLRLTTGPGVSLGGSADFFDLRGVGPLPGLPNHDWGISSVQWTHSRIADDPLDDAFGNSATAPPANSTDYDVSYLFDGVIARLYVNDALVMQTTLDVGVCSFDMMMIGGNASNAFTGVIKRCAIFGYELTSSGRRRWESAAW